MDEGPADAQPSSQSSSPSSESLLSRHLFALQNQVRVLQQEVQHLRSSEDFGDDRLANLEQVTRSLNGSVQGISSRISRLERDHALQAAGLQAQAAFLARLARRVATLEQANF